MAVPLWLSSVRVELVLFVTHTLLAPSIATPAVYYVDPSQFGMKLIW